MSLDSLQDVVLHLGTQKQHHPMQSPISMNQCLEYFMSTPYLKLFATSTLALQDINPQA